jgi:fluoride exporter
MNWLLVFIGGGLGSLVRYAISLIFNKLDSNFPLATLISNVVACFIIGILVGLTMKGQLPDRQRLLFVTGFCGGFSTFSTFSNETIQLWMNGNTTHALLNILFSLILCILATFVGLKLMI